MFCLFVCFVFCISSLTSHFTVERALLWMTGPLQSNFIPAMMQWLTNPFRNLRGWRQKFCVYRCVSPDDRIYHSDYQGSFISIQNVENSLFTCFSSYPRLSYPPQEALSPVGTPRSLGAWVMVHCFAGKPEFPHLVCAGPGSNGRGWLFWWILDPGEA